MSTVNSPHVYTSDGGKEGNGILERLNKERIGMLREYTTGKKGKSKYDGNFEPYWFINTMEISR